MRLAGFKNLFCLPVLPVARAVLLRPRQSPNPAILKLREAPPFSWRRPHPYIGDVYRLRREAFLSLISMTAVPVRYAMFKLGYSRFDVEGIDKIPKLGSGPVIFAANHQSNLDPPMLGVVLAWHYSVRTWSMAKKELFESPANRFFFPRMGVLPFDRQAKGEDQIRSLMPFASVLLGGAPLMVFPEGTRPSETVRKNERMTVSRRDVNRHTGLLLASDLVPKLAIATGAKIIPVGISGTGAVRPPEKPWSLIEPQRLAELKAEDPSVERIFTKRRKRDYAIRICIGDPIDPRAMIKNSDEASDTGLAFWANRTMMPAISHLVDHSLNEVPIQVPMRDIDFAAIDRHRALLARARPDLFPEG